MNRTQLRVLINELSFVCKSIITKEFNHYVIKKILTWRFEQRYDHAVKSKTRSKTISHGSFTNFLENFCYHKNVVEEENFTLVYTRSLLSIQIGNLERRMKNVRMIYEITNALLTSYKRQ